METVSVVIGANYGDEGKGRVVSYLANEQTLVVRHSGGAQAGHTVHRGDRRHVFHHFGSGTLDGAATFLSEHFIVNPIVFLQEFEALKIPRLEERVFIDPLARVTTPWDMLINQGMERKLGASRHGSCGLGIHETMVRHNSLPFSVVDLLTGQSNWTRKLKMIQFEWAPKRMQALGLTMSDVPLLYSDQILQHFIHDIWEFLRKFGDLRWYSEHIEKKWRHLVFEGAQGLLLDEDNKEDFPYVTHSKTGLTNAVKLLNTAGLANPIDVYYCTRAYLTRHGAGPLPNEYPKKPLDTIIDDTNITNEWQGGLRFAPLDVDRLQNSIMKDMLENNPERWYRMTPWVVVSCADQLAEGSVQWIKDEKFRSTDHNSFFYSVCPDWKHTLIGYGPSMGDLLELENPLRKKLDDQPGSSLQ